MYAYVCVCVWVCYECMRGCECVCVSARGNWSEQFPIYRKRSVGKMVKRMVIGRVFMRATLSRLKSALPILLANLMNSMCEVKPLFGNHVATPFTTNLYNTTFIANEIWSTWASLAMWFVYNVIYICRSTTTTKLLHKNFSI